jgi:hypothetical protein
MVQGRKRPLARKLTQTVQPYLVIILLDKKDRNRPSTSGYHHFLN